MKIKKYEALTEAEAIEKVKIDLGEEALILNIKKVQPKGFYAIFKKPKIEVTAAYEEKISLPKEVEFKKQYLKNRNLENKENTGELVVKDIKIIEQNEKIKELEEKLTSTEDLLEKVVTQLTVTSQTIRNGKRKYENALVQVFYDALISQEVTPEIAEKLLEEVDNVEDEEEIDINLLVKIVYNLIVNILGEPETIDISNIKEKKPIVVSFIGPTGVGKTTTIAKLSSNFILNNDLDVGLITADTYRIAAIDQLKTYAEILNIDVSVVYNSFDLLDNINNMSKVNDIILIDTAGRSHKNKETLEELKTLIEAANSSEKYLVLSITTKYQDLLSIVKTYANITEFKIIFTKLDETTCLGSILNICYETGRKISYITNGQAVPDDIEVISPEKIAKALLGLGGALR